VIGESMERNIPMVLGTQAQLQTTTGQSDFQGEDDVTIVRGSSLGMGQFRVTGSTTPPY